MTDNTVLSSVIAEASISYQGKGAVNSGQAPGIIARLINWLF
jgi:flagellar L-ring protein precursor FlgH